MSDFGIDKTDASPIGVASTVKTPVQPDNAGLKGLANIFDSAVKVRGQYTERKNKGLVAEFTSNQLKIIDAVDQGVYDRKTGRQMIRQSFIEASNGNPALQEELMKAQNFVLGQGGMGGLLTEQSREEESIDRVYNDMLDKGLIHIGASDQEIKAKAVDYQAYLRQVESTSERMRQLDLRIKEGDLSDAEIKRAKEERSRIAERTLIDGAPLEYDRFNNMATEILNSNMSPAEKTQAVEQQWAEMQAQFSPFLQQVSSTQGNAFLSSLEARKELLLKQISGDITTESVNKQIALTQAIHQSRLFEDEEFAKAYSEISLFKDMDPSLATPAIVNGMSAIARIMNQNSGGPESPKLPADPYVKEIKDYVNILSQDTGGDEQKEKEQVNQGLSLLQAISDYEVLLRKDPSQAVHLNEAMASPGFLNLRQKHDAEFGEVAQEALDVWQRNFEDEVMSMVKKEFTDRNVTPHIGNAAEAREEDGISVQSSVVYTTNSNGVEFVASNPEDPSSRDAAHFLNKKLKPIINTSVRAASHLAGRTDYGTVFSEMAEQYLGGEATALGDGDADLSMDDFIKGLSEQAPTLLKVVDVTEGTSGDYNTLLGNQEDGIFRDINVSERTLGWLLEFTGPNGAYASYSRREVGRMATPMGRYQIVGQTLRTTMKEMGLDSGQVFTPELQDAMFVHLAKKALNGTTSQQSKRQAMRAVWEGFKHASDATLDAAIAEFENNV